MTRQFEVRWQGEFAATPQQVWDAFTVHTDGWLWKIDYEPRAGGTERGLTSGGGKVTVWDPPRQFTTLAPDVDGINQLDYRLESRGARTYLRYVHQGVIGGDYERELDACRQHTTFYYHSLGEYLHHFAGLDATYVSVDAPEASMHDGFAALRGALGVADDVVVGDKVRLEPTGMEPIEGVIDYATRAFLGMRTADALYRFYGRDAWGWPVGVAHHLFAADDADACTRAWRTWLNDLFTTTAVTR